MKRLGLINNQKLKYFAQFIITTIFVISVIFLFRNFIDIHPISFAEWLNNYQSGFIRRAIFGNLAFILSDKFNIHLLKIVLSIQILIHTIFYLCLIFLIHKINKFNFLYLFIILGPLGLIFPIAELEALGRQEIFFLSMLALLSVIFINSNNIFLSQLIIILVIPIILLSHEGMIFFFSYLILLNYLFLDELKFKYKLEINIFYIFFSIILFLYFYITFNNNINIDKEVCNSLNEYLNYERCITLNGINKISESKNNAIIQFFQMSKLNEVFFTLAFIFFGFLPFFKLFKFNEIYLASFKFDVKILFILCLLMSMPIYLTIDWGRWTYVNYTSMIIVFLYLTNKNLLNINYNLISNYLIKINYKYKILLLFLFCFSWNLKILNIDDRGSFPLFRSLVKSLKFLLEI